MGSAERIKNGAQLIIDAPGERKMLVVSAMGGVPKVKLLPHMPHYALH